MRARVAAAAEALKVLHITNRSSARQASSAPLFRLRAKTPTRPPDARSYSPSAAIGAAASAGEARTAGAAATKVRRFRSMRLVPLRLRQKLRRVAQSWPSFRSIESLRLEITVGRRRAGPVARRGSL